VHTGESIIKKLIIVTSLFLTQNLFAETIKGFDTDVYGWIRASAIYSSGGVASFSNTNAVAPTHAAARTSVLDDTSRLSFQLQQSRIGTTLKKKDILARFEFDFVDFNKATPTTQMVPRVRIASVTYGWDNQKVIIGQDWDLFSPTSPFTYNYVGNYYLAGNSGFMRQQLQYLRTEGDYELGGAIGLANSNPAANESDTELSRSPSYAARINKKLENGKIGLSGIYAHLSYKTTNLASRDAYGLNAFYEKTFGLLGLRSEVYYGQNLANLGSLTLGKGTGEVDVKEYGGFASARYKISEKNFVFGGAGIAMVDNRSEIPTVSAAIRKNFLTRFGWEYLIQEDFSWITEVSRYDTTSKLGDNRYQLNIVGSLESGIQLRF
jgi:hypothetical protein